MTGLFLFPGSDCGFCSLLIPGLSVDDSLKLILTILNQDPACTRRSFVAIFLHKVRNTATQDDIIITWRKGVRKLRLLQKNNQGKSCISKGAASLPQPNPKLHCHPEL